LLDFTTFLRGLHPDVDLQVMAAAGRTPVQALTNRHRDLIVISGAPAQICLVKMPLFEDELLFIMPSGHRHAGKPFINGPDIVGEDFIAYTNRNRTASLPGCFGLPKAIRAGRRPWNCPKRLSSLLPPGKAPAPWLLSQRWPGS